MSIIDVAGADIEVVHPFPLRPRLAAAGLAAADRVSPISERARAETVPRDSAFPFRGCFA